MFDPFVLAGLAVDIKVTGIPLGEAELDAGGVGHFELSDTEGPEPGGVEVGVAHGIDGVSGFGGYGTESVFDEFTALFPGFSVGFLEGVADVVEGPDEEVVGGVSFGE